MTMDLSSATPVLMYHPTEDTCAGCGEEISLAMIAIGAKDAGPLCDDCAEQLPHGKDLARLAEALDEIDTVIYHLPDVLRPGTLAVAHDTLDAIAQWRKPTEPA